MRHRILHWGIIGAIVFRGVFVVIGTGLLAFGPWVEIAFALIVAWTAVAMLKGGDDDDEAKDYSQHLACRFAKSSSPYGPGCTATIFREPQAARGGSTDGRAGHEPQRPKAACSLRRCSSAFVIEVSDVLFAFDSVPAVIAVSREPLIVYSAMLFAILGLRTLYFVLEALKRYVVHLERPWSSCCSSSQRSWA